MKKKLNNGCRELYTNSQKTLGEVDKMAADEIKRNFMAHMSHELRTPLNGIIGIVELLKKTSLNPQQVRYTQAISQAADTLLELINTILELKNLQSENCPDDEEFEFNLHDLVSNLTSLFLGEIKKKGLFLETHIDNDLPNKVSGNYSGLSQVINNLLSNAIKFTDKGKIVIAITRKSETEDEIKLQFSVSDTGIGIVEDNYEKMFESFSQLDSGYTRKYAGAGLGLTVAGKMVESMGGKISVRSVMGQGSNFSFKIKLKKKTGIQMKVIQIREKNISDSDSLSEFKNTKLLIAEDSRINRIAVEGIAKSLDLDLEIATTGKEAIEKVLKNNYDLILMDIHMPQMDGLEATRRIREIEKSRDKHAIIYVLSAYPLVDEFKVKCLEAGFDGFLKKPLSEAKLKELILGVYSSEIQINNDGNKLDLDLLLKELGGRKNLLLKLVAYFLSSYKNQLLELAKAINEKDCRRIEILAHTLKGELENLRIQRGAELAYRIQMMGAEKKYDAIESTMKLLENELESTADYLRNAYNF